jgi:hypothetical protein
MVKNIILLLISLSVSSSCIAQHSDDATRTRQLEVYQDSLVSLGKTMVNNENDLERINANTAFIKTLVSALKVPNSFLFKFDSLKTISILNSPDNRFRILSWHIVYEDGSYRFYGTIQMNTGGNLLMYPLEDYSPLLKQPEDSVTGTRKWFGAQYYKIIQVNDNHPYYILLGWKGTNDKTTRKVIDVLSFKDAQPQLGLAIFDGNGKTRKRVVFEYTRQASMLLRYVPEQHLIVFDHLAAPDPRAKNNPALYGPDMSYNGYKLKNGRWVFVENLDMRNVPNEHDAEYVDPKKQAELDKQAAKQNN